MKGKSIKLTSGEEKGKVFISLLCRITLCIILILLCACGDGSDTPYEASSGVVSIPTLLTPSNGSTVRIGRFNLAWSSGAKASEYQIQCSTDSGFASTVMDKAVTTTSYTPITPVTLDEFTTLFDNGLSYNGHIYRVTKGVMTWHGADSLAKQHGGYLVTVNDAAENQFLTNNCSFLSSEQWIGYTDKANEGTWLWANGDPATYTNWDRGEPNDSGGEDCAIIFAWGTWNDLPCSHTLCAIVEWESSIDSDLPLSDNTYYWRVKAKDSEGNESGWSEVWNFTVSSEPGVAETEPNNDMDHAESLTSGELILGQLTSRSDQDWFAISTLGAGVINVSLQIDTVYDNDFWHISIVDPSGNELTKGSCCRENQETQFHWQVSEAATYYVVITEYSIGDFYRYQDDTYTLTVWLY